MKQSHFPYRLLAVLLALVCLVGLLPTSAMAAETEAPETITLADYTVNGMGFNSASLGFCRFHRIDFNVDGNIQTAFCSQHGMSMAAALAGHSWGRPQRVTDPTVTTLMAFFYAHTTGIFTDQAHAMGVDDLWNEERTWMMNAWVQSAIWRFEAGTLGNPVVACAEELIPIYNRLAGTSYTSIDESMGDYTFRDFATLVLDLGERSVWGECKVYEYDYTDAGAHEYWADYVQSVMVGELTVTHEQYSLIVKKVDATNPSLTLPGARFRVASADGSFFREFLTGQDGTYTLDNLAAGTYTITELEAPEGYQIDQAVQYVSLPGVERTATVTFEDTPVITGTGSIRKVDADNPARGLAGAVIRIEGVDNNFVGTYVTGAGGYLTDVPWDTMPIGSYTAEEVTPPAGYTLSPDANKVKQAFHWDGRSDVSLVFENDTRVKVQLIKLDDSGRPLPGAVFNILKDGQLIGTEATKADGTITVTDVTEGLYAFVEVSAPTPYATLTEPVIVHVHQADISGGTVTVMAVDKKLPSLTILKRDAQTKEVIPGTVFEIKGIHYQYHDDVTTDADGRAVLSNIPVDSYEVIEKSVPDPYVIGDEPSQTIYLGPGESRELIFDNLKQPVLKISKVEKGTNTPIPGTVFTVAGIDSDYRHDVTTEADGFAALRVAPGSYRVTEKSVPAPYCLSEDEADQTQTISLNGGDEKTLIFKNSKKPLLTLSKIDADTGLPVPGTVLTVEGIDNDYQNDWTTGADGTVSFRIDPGTYRITEKSVPAPYYLPDNDADRVQTISLSPGDEKTVVFRNHKTPELTIFKEDSVAGAPIEGAKFHITYTSNGESAGAPAYMDFGYFVTDARGEIILHEEGKKLYPGEYTVTEAEPAPGFQLKGPTTQKVILHGGESKTLTFFNEPLNAIVVEKFDSVTHEALPGCTFQLRFLGGTSGTGGTVIGQKVTGKNGTAIWTGLTAGTYIVEEISPADGYSIINSSETVCISDDGVQNVITVSFDNAPDGILLIRKVCSVNPSVTLQDAEFKVMYADGTLIGDSNGIYRTDENGEVSIPGLKPGKSVVVTEVRAPAGFIIDTQSQTVQIKEGRTVSLTFKNQPKGSLIIQKRDSITGQPLPGAEFRVTTAAGCEVGLDGVIGTSSLTQNGLFTTDAQGEIRITNLVPGAYVLTEIKAPAGYVIDTPSTNVVIGANGDTQTVVITNTPKGGLLIRKIDSVTGTALPGVKFKITAANGELVPDNDGLTSSNGLYTTDENGQIYLSKLNPNTYVVTEVETIDGYLLDAAPQTVVVSEADTQVLTFTNMPLGGLLVKKMDSATKEPLADVIFKITRTDGTVVGNSNGEYRTDERGFISLPDLEPGGYIVREVQAKPGYLLDDTPHAVEIKNHQTYTLEVFNQPLGNLIINKSSSADNSPLEGVKFQIKYANGQVVDNRNGQVSSNGIYYTDRNGQIILSGITGTVVVTELETIPGYRIDPNSRTQTVVINPNDTQTINFYNTPTTTLIIRKFIEGTENEPLSGVAFKVVDGSGAAVGPDDGCYYTDKAGEIVLDGIEPGTTVKVREIKTVEGFVLDETPQDILIKAGTVQQLTFWNKRAGELVICKLDSVTKKPLAGVEFELTYAGGGYVDNANGHLSSKGLYTTDANGEIRISGVTGTIVARETRTISGYIIDEATRTQTVEVRPEDTQVLTFYNTPQQALIIQKYVDGTTVPIQNVTFLVTDSSGAVVGPNNGEYVTDRNGRIVITDLNPGTTITAREIRTVDGYVLDTTPQSILIKQGVAQALTFYNTPIGGLELIKVNEADRIQRIPGVVFEIRRMDGGLVETVTTSKNGRVYDSLEAGDYYAVEVQAADGFKMDTTPHYFTIRDGKTTTLAVTNRPFSGVLIHKTDSITGKGVPGVTFLVYDSKFNPIGQITTDQSGFAYLDELDFSGRLYLRELDNPGYVVDTQLKTVYVKTGETTLIEWQNAPITGQIQILKTSADYNSINGWPAGSPIPGTVFEIYDQAGNLVDTVQTDKNGVAASKPLPLGRYQVVESQSADFYLLDKTPITAELEFAGQIVRVAMTNRSVSTGVSIAKRGYREVMPGQSLRYTFSSIANTSSVPLSSFYWRDRLPVEAVRLAKITTGTYSAAGSYKIVFRTNLSGDEYRTMYDNLNTQQNYVLEASPAALRLASNEYVTEVMFIFGVVPAGFRQVEAPMIDCTVLPGLANGLQFVNQADVGGVYGGQWVQAVSRWTTKVYAPTKPQTLPRTGF